MIYNQHDWDENGMPVHDQDLTPGYDELEGGIDLSTAETIMIWSCIGLAILAIAVVIFFCVTYEPPS